MADTRHRESFRLVRALISAGTSDGLTDGELIERFLAAEGESAHCAFTALVARHGPVVFRVCRSLLRDPHDADDAFQATFLALVQHAASIQKRDSAASWLYGVAYRTAARSRSAAARRRRHERRAAEQAPQFAAQPCQDDIAAVLTEEIRRLPAHYRTAVVLCALEGLTQERAAERLGWPLGTVRSRLARGRERLRARLARRGLAPALAACAAGATAPAATLSEQIVQKTVRAATQYKATGVLPRGVDAVPGQLIRKGATSMMSGSGLKVMTLCVASIGIAVAGARILVGQERKETSNAPVADRPAPTPAMAAKVDALERRVQDLEQKLAHLLAAPRVRSGSANGRNTAALESAAVPTRKVRLRFASLIEKIDVKEGQSVKRGDALAEIYSTDLIAAKNDLITKTTQSEQDRRLVQARAKLHSQGALATQVLVDTQNDEAKSRLEVTLARERLALYGLSREEIDAVNDEEGEQKGRFTLRAPVAGVVASIEAQVDDLLDPQAVVLTLRPTAP